MMARQNHCQVWLFMDAVLLSCAVLVGLSLRRVRPDRELAEKGVAEERRRIGDGVREELLITLERRKCEGASLAGGSTNPGPLGVSYADRRWLASVVPPVGLSPAVPVVVQARGGGAAFESGTVEGNESPAAARVGIGDDRKGEPLGAGLPGLQVVLTIPMDKILAWEWSLQRELHLVKLRSQFVTSASHERKTPLTAIRLFAETLGMGSAANPRVQGEYLETMFNEPQRLTRLLDNVLDFSKVDRGKSIDRAETTGTVDKHRSLVRTKRETDAAKPRHFLTVHGAG